MEKQKRVKVFIENIFVYGIFGSLNKIIPIIMLPILTRIITDTSEYGAYSMFTTIQSFGIQIAELGLYDAAFREYFEKDDDEFHNSVLSTALSIVGLCSVMVGIIMSSFSKGLAGLLIGDEKYKWLIILSAVGIVVGASRSILSLPVRIKNERSVFVSTNLLQSLLNYGIALVLILVFNEDYTSLIYSNIITSLLLTVFFYLYSRKAFSISSLNKIEARELLKIGIPLVPIFITYWVFNSFDKIMITNMLGLHYVGIYTIGARVASVAQVIYTAFATGWQYFAFTTMKDDDQVELTSKIMEYLGLVSVSVFLLATIFDKPVFAFFFDGEYELGYVVFPYLFLSPLLLMIFQTGANQFIVYKKSYLSTICLLIGSLSNIVLNYFLIKLSGITGAAFATLLGYLLSIVTMVLINYRHKWIIVSKKMVLLWAIVFIMCLKVHIHDDAYSHCLAVFLEIVLFVLYKNDFGFILKSMKSVISKR